MYCDTHAHLNFKEYKNEIPEVIERASDENVQMIINIGSNYQTSQKAIDIAISNKRQVTSKNTNYIELYAVVGCHPIHLVKDITETATFDDKEYKFTTKKEEFDSNKYQKLIDSSDKIVGVGETGLDYFRLDENNKLQNPNNKSQINNNIQITKRNQKKVFIEHIKLAKKNNLPLVLHCRGTKDDPCGAYDEMLQILKSEILNLKSELSGIIHCFGGNLKQANEFIKLGFYVGVNGIVTFKNSQELQSIIKEIPLNQILLETDCPFLAPDPYRGKRNEPMYIPIIAQKIAELKAIDISEVEKQTTENAKKLFNI